MAIDSAERELEARVSPSKGLEKSLRVIWAQHWQMYLMLLPALLFLAFFRFLQIWGIAIAFVDYSPFRGISGSDFVGLYHFRRFLTSRHAPRLFRNTLFIAISKIVFGQITAVFFALLLNEIRSNTYRRISQTVATLPNFMSWIIIGGMMTSVLASDGLVNRGVQLLGFEPIRFLGTPAIFPWTLIFSNVWKGFGWGAIIYLAALTSINPELYQAAAVDGANRWQRLLHITLPGIKPMIILLACLNLGGVLNAGFTQILVLMNPAVQRTGDILDTYVYRVGILRTDFSLGTAVGLFKSFIGFFLILLSYYLADKLADYRIF